MKTATPRLTVVLDDDAYLAAAKSFLRKLVRPLVATCIRQGLIHPNPGGALSESDLVRVYDIGFVLLTTLEDREGFQHHGNTAFVSVVFSTQLPSGETPLNYVGSAKRTALHGTLDDDILQAAAAAEHKNL